VPGTLGRRDFTGGSKTPLDDRSTSMTDLLFVVLAVAFFVLAAVVVKGVERL
jgi:hypothetical protein